MMQVIYGSAQNKAHSFFLKCNIKYFLWKYSKWQIFFNKNVFSSLSSKMLNQQLSIFVLSVLKLKGWFLHQQCVKTKTKGLQKLINTHTHTHSHVANAILNQSCKSTLPVSASGWLYIILTLLLSVCACLSIRPFVLPSGASLCVWCFHLSVCLCLSVCKSHSVSWSVP